MASIYDLKPRFQALLRPLSDALVRAKLSANDVTLGALLLSAAHGAWLALMPGSAWPLLLLPVLSGLTIINRARRIVAEAKSRGA